MIERDELVKKIEDLKEESDYYEKKVSKLEVDNKSLRLGNNQYKRVKDLEDEVEALKQQL
jgi:cell division protein FtsB